MGVVDKDGEDRKRFVELIFFSVGFSEGPGPEGRDSEGTVGTLEGYREGESTRG